jgi:hypothetical protein
MVVLGIQFMVEVELMLSRHKASGFLGLIPGTRTHTYSLV